ncbi:MAG TPA: preprotein translocase subunit YajC [Longimicrobiales bacterium]|nr:preprotein translocase subunit YajC [Longimicrobiales bacterium]
MSDLLAMVPREGGNAMLIFFVQMAAFIAIFYFLLIRPQKKEQERHKQMLEAIKKGDEVVTSGGIVGKVVKADETRLTIQSGDSTFVVQRGRVAQRLGDEPTE